VFPPQTNDFQKPIKFVSTSGKVFFGKESEKDSEEKPIEKSSGEKPSEQPQPKHKPKLVKFHCGYCGKEGHKDEFCSKRKREEGMAKEWANKDRYNPSHDVPKPRMPLPRGKAMVRSIPTWGDASSCSRGVVLERAVRPAWLGEQTSLFIGSHSLPPLWSPNWSFTYAKCTAGKGWGNTTYMKNFYFELTNYVFQIALLDFCCCRKHMKEV
jgi:hypothetical protein